MEQIHQIEVTAYNSIHHWSRYEEDAEFLQPKAGLSYQYDSRNDTHYSYISSFDLALLINDSQSGEYVDPYLLLHLCDRDLPSLKRLFAKKVILPVELEDLSYVAMTQRFGIDNRKISDMLFTHLLTNGFEVDDIIEELDSGAYPEVEEDYPNLRRSLKSLQAKAMKGGVQ